MPGFIATAISQSIICPHSGEGKTTPFQNVTLSGVPVVTQPPTWTVVGCKLSPNAGGPCATAVWSTFSTNVFAGGSPVILIDSQSTCAPTGVPLTVARTQSKVTAK